MDFLSLQQQSFYSFVSWCLGHGKQSLHTYMIWSQRHKTISATVHIYKIIILYIFCMFLRDHFVYLHIITSYTLLLLSLVSLSSNINKNGNVQQHFKTAIFGTKTQIAQHNTLNVCDFLTLASFLTYQYSAEVMSCCCQRFCKIVNGCTLFLYKFVVPSYKRAVPPQQDC